MISCCRILLLIIFQSLALISYSCTCAYKTLTKEDLANFDHIAIVTVKKLNPFKNTDATLYKADVETLEVFKGNKISSLLVRSVNTSCDMGVRKDAVWIVFANIWNGHPSIGPCSFNEQLFGVIPGEYSNWYYERGLSTLDFLRSHYYKPSFNGVFRKKWLNGNLSATFSMRNGKWSGDKLWYNEKGKLILKEQFTDGDKNGLSTIWYPNRLVHSKVNYSLNKKSGEEVRNYLSGQIMKKLMYEKGELEGLVQEWDVFSNLIYTAQYKHGLQIDTAYRWYSIDTTALGRVFYTLASSKKISEDSAYALNNKRQLQSIIINDSIGRLIKKTFFYRNGTLEKEIFVEPNTKYIVTHEYDEDGKTKLYMLQWIAGKNEYGGDDIRTFYEELFFHWRGFRKHTKFFDNEGKKIVKVIEFSDGKEKIIYPKASK